MCSVLPPACRFFPRAVFAIHVFGLSDDPFVPPGSYDCHDEDVDNDDGADDDADDVEDDAGDGGDGDDGDAYDDDGFDDDADAICTALYATRLMRSPAPALQPSDCD